MLTEKFNSLMDLTKASNVSFAKTFSFDASYISKIRAGGRKMPDDPGLLLDMSVFFAEQIRRKKIEPAAAALIDCGSWPDDIETASFLIRNWLLTGSGDSFCPDPDPGDFSPLPERISPKQDDTDTASMPSTEKTLTYYGNKGQRTALLRACEILCMDPKPYNIMVYSDEPLSWFSEDRGFFDIWKQYCFRLIQAGSTFTMIDYLHRNLDEMKEGFRMWIPLILTGRVRAYCCDGLKNIFFDRTLCIAENHLAVAYNSIHANDCRSVCTLYMEKDAVDALSYEFRRYLDLCRPLFDTCLPSDAPELRKRLLHFSSFEADFISMGSSAAPFMFSRNFPEPADGDPDSYEPALKPGDSSASVIRLLEKGFSVCTILFLPKKEDLIDGKVNVPMGFLLGKNRPFFRPEEYISMLENMLDLAEKYPNCKIIVSSSGRFPDEMFLMLKSSENAFLSVTGPEERVFCVSEPSVISSLHRLLTGYLAVPGIRIVNKTLIRKYISGIKQLVRL